MTGMMTIMQKKIIYCIVIIIVTSTNVINAREEWIDPHDMNIRVNSIEREDLENSKDHKSCYCNDNLLKDKSSSYLRKVITLLTDMTYFDRGSDVYKGVIDIHLKTKDYDFLRKFISRKFNDEYDFMQLNSVLDNSIEKSFYTSYIFTFYEFLYSVISNERVLLCSGLSILLYFLWRIQPQNYKLKTLFKLFFPLVYIADFVLRYKAKIEEVEIDQYLEYENYKACDPDSLGWIDWLYDKYTGYCKDNKKKFLLSQRPSFHLFTPMTVLSEQFDVFVTILKHLGTGFGAFMWAIMEQSPWYIKPIMGLFSCVLVMILLIFIASYSLGLSPKFSLFHLIYLEVLHKENINAGNKQDTISGENLTNLIKSKQEKPMVILAGPSSQKKNSITFKRKPKFICYRKPKPVAINDVS